jgi:hypothetical protein
VQSVKLCNLQGGKRFQADIWVMGSYRRDSVDLSMCSYRPLAWASGSHKWLAFLSTSTMHLLSPHKCPIHHLRLWWRSLQPPVKCSPSQLLQLHSFPIVTIRPLLMNLKLGTSPHPPPSLPAPFTNQRNPLSQTWTSGGLRRDMGMMDGCGSNSKLLV